MMTFLNNFIQKEYFIFNDVRRCRLKPLSSNHRFVFYCKLFDNLDNPKIGYIIPNSASSLKSNEMFRIQTRFEQASNDITCEADANQPTNLGSSEAIVTVDCQHSMAKYSNRVS